MGAPSSSSEAGQLNAGTVVSIFALPGEGTRIACQEHAESIKGGCGCAGLVERKGALAHDDGGDDGGDYATETIAKAAWHGWV